MLFGSLLLAPLFTQLNKSLNFLCTTYLLLNVWDDLGYEQVWIFSICIHISYCNSARFIRNLLCRWYFPGNFHQVFLGRIMSTWCQSVKPLKISSHEQRYFFRGRKDRYKHSRWMKCSAITLRETEWTRFGFFIGQISVTLLFALLSQWISFCTEKTSVQLPSRLAEGQAVSRWRQSKSWPWSSRIGIAYSSPIPNVYIDKENDLNLQFPWMMSIWNDKEIQEKLMQGEAVREQEINVIGKWPI